MATAILIDGGFFIKKIRNLYGNKVGYDAQAVADIIFECSLSHLKRKWESKQEMEDLYRIFFYDCTPMDYKGHNPITKKAIDFTATEEFKFRTELHNNLKKKRKVALRLGHVSKNTSWGIKPSVVKKIIKSNDDPEKIKLSENDVNLSFTQKGVDMRIGIDIASLSLKKIVHQIVLVAGDADFVPAAKLARREGVDFILDPIDNKIPDDLFEHIDGVKQTLQKVMKIRDKKNNKQQNKHDSIKKNTLHDNPLLKDKEN